MTKRVLWSIAAVCIGLAGPPAVVAAQQQQPTTITGRITSDGTPLTGALVAIPSLGLGDYTDSDGTYSISAPASAFGRTVTLTARRIGYTPDSAQIMLSGGPISRDLELVVAPTQLQGRV